MGSLRCPVDFFLRYSLASGPEGEKGRGLVLWTPILYSGDSRVLRFFGSGLKHLTFSRPSPIISQISSSNATAKQTQKVPTYPLAGSLPSRPRTGFLRRI
jgi:hypothetical protein